VAEDRILLAVEGTLVVEDTQVEVATPAAEVAIAAPATLATTNLQQVSGTVVRT